MTASGIPIKITPGGGIEVAKKPTPAKASPAPKSAVKTVAPTPVKAPLKAPTKFNGAANAPKKVAASTAAPKKVISKASPAKTAAPRKLTM